MKATIQNNDPDRRTARRYPIEREMLWKLTGRSGPSVLTPGRSVNMSRAGVLFSSERPIPIHKSLEVTINLPTATNSSAPLQLIARGRVVRSSDGLAAVQFRQRDFHASRPGD